MIRLQTRTQDGAGTSVAGAPGRSPAVTTLPRFVLLPGLDGSSELARRFVDARPGGTTVDAASLPREPLASYSELAERLLPSLPHEPFVLIGNSFSGPLALRLASVARPLAVVLCATFVRPPVPERPFLDGPLSFLTRVRPPAPAASVFLTGGDIELACQVVQAVRCLPRDVLAARARMVLEVDAIRDLSSYAGPLLYLRATEDLVVVRDQLSSLRRARADLVWHDVEAPHLILQTQPRQCWRHVVDFTKSLPEAAHGINPQPAPRGSENETSRSARRRSSHTKNRFRFSMVQGNICSRGTSCE